MKSKFVSSPPSFLISTGLLEFWVFRTKTAFLSGWQSKSSQGHPYGHLNLENIRYRSGLSRTDYLAGTVFMMIFKIFDATRFTIFVFITIKNALPQFNAILSNTSFKIFVVLWSRLVTANAYWVGATSTTIGTTELTRTSRITFIQDTATFYKAICTTTLHCTINIIYFTSGCALFSQFLVSWNQF